MRNLKLLGLVLALAAASAGCGGKSACCSQKESAQKTCPPNCDKPCCKNTGK